MSDKPKNWPYLVVAVPIAALRFVRQWGWCAVGLHRWRQPYSSSEWVCTKCWKVHETDANRKGEA